MSEELLQRSYEARNAYLRQMGVVDEMLLAPLMNPSLMGGPRWPAMRQSWRRVKDGKSTILVSDGLSDPFDDVSEPNQGFALEILAETADELPEQVQGTWLFDLVYSVSQQAAYHGGVRELIDELGVLSLEIPPVEELQPLAGPSGGVGLLLGLTSPRWTTEWDLPAGTVKVITAKLLTPAELAFVVDQGEAGRERLRELFAADGSDHVSSLARASVV